MAEDYRKEVEVGDLVTRKQRVSTKLKSSNTLTRNQTIGSFLVNHTFIKMACDIHTDYLDENYLAFTSNLNCSIHISRGFCGFVSGNIFLLFILGKLFGERLNIEREKIAN